MTAHPAGGEDPRMSSTATQTDAATRPVRPGRRAVPRSALAAWSPPEGRDALAVLRDGDRDRLPDLLPLRYERMGASAFAFMRGSAAVMATDLAGLPDSGLQVQVCGDAHISNFGMFATPERRLVYDLNDFDETFRAPFEWDVKRLAVSVVMASREAGPRRRDARAAATAGVRAYRAAMARMAAMSFTDAWFLSAEVDDILERLTPEQAAATRLVIAKARRRTSARAVSRLTERDADGALQFQDQPPLLQRIPLDTSGMQVEFDAYLASLPPERRVLLARYRPVDAALKVVGVGSVGTRCFVLLLVGRDDTDVMVLQVKEAGPSALQVADPGQTYEHEGHRVVEGQRLLQAAGDPFLGWSTSQNGRDFYWRQLWDMKGSIDPVVLRPPGMVVAATLSGAVLARAHARSRDAADLQAYMGRSSRFDDAVLVFALAYADQMVLDHADLLRSEA
jgi:uncharacterized protein (DUF2252 family)